jgi:hypothetical protein
MEQSHPGSQHQAGVTLVLADVPYVPIAKSDRADNALRQARGHSPAFVQLASIRLWLRV